MLAKLLCIAAVVLAACSSSGGAGGEPPLGEVPKNPEPSTLALPLDTYLVTGEEDWVAFASAQDVLVQACMQGQGFDWPVPSREPGTRTRNERRYGLADLEVARSYGYRPPPDPPAEAQLRFQQERARTISADEQRAFSGEPGPKPGGPGGCLGESYKDLGAQDLQADTSFVEALGGDALTRAEEDSRVVGVLDAWSSCMAEKGYDYETTQDAVYDYSSGQEGGSDQPPEGGLDQTEGGFDEEQAATQEEKDTAMADVECKQAHNVVGVQFAVESAYQEEIIDGNEERLRTIAERRDEMLRRAAEVTGSG